MLANLVMVTRPESEIKDFDAAAEWVGMPDYDPSPEPKRIVVSFRNEDDRAEFARRLDVLLDDTMRMSIWWPNKEKDDISSVRFDG